MRAVTAVAVACAMTLMACGGAQGEQGPQGPQGEKGDKGETGSPGGGTTGFNQTQNYYCLDASGASADIYKFPDGSVLVSCEVLWTMDGVTSGFAIWRAGQAGTATARCVVFGMDGAYATFTWNGNLGGSLVTTTSSGTTTHPLTCTKY